MNAYTSPHKGWMTGLAAALLFLFATGFLADSYSSYAQERLSVAELEHQRATKQLEQWKEDSATAKTLRQHLSDADVARLLEAGNPKAMTAKLEPLAAASRLSNFSYTLSPLQPWDGHPSFSGIEGIVKSTLTIEADTPHDGDVFAFLNELSTLQGKFTLTELHISPIKEAKDRPLSALNLHARATLDWLVNAP